MKKNASKSKKEQRAGEKRKTFKPPSHPIARIPSQPEKKSIPKTPADKY